MLGYKSYSCFATSAFKYLTVATPLAIMCSSLLNAYSADDAPNTGGEILTPYSFAIAVPV